MQRQYLHYKDYYAKYNIEGKNWNQFIKDQDTNSINMNL